MNLVIVSSVINISNKALSYTKVRSVFSVEERYEQTLRTLESIRKIKDSKILHIEASRISLEQEQVIKSMCDIYVNLYEKEDSDLIAIIEGKNKSLAESTLIYEGISGVNLSEYENIYKISGRYWLNDAFDYSKWDNKKSLFRTDGASLSTCLYKVNKKDFDIWMKTLIRGKTQKKILGIFPVTEMIETIFMEEMGRNFETLNNQGLGGYVSVDGSEINY